jgi:polyphosphate glucokinase
LANAAKLEQVPKALSCGDSMKVLGIDIGGTGIKGAVVETDSGELLTERYRLLTPQPSKPRAVAKVVADVVQHFEWTGSVGCTFPAIVHHGMILSAANVHPAWIGKNAQQILQEATGRPTVVMNDADAAGVAEMKFGAGRGHDDLVFMITLGTGIGSAIFYRGQLVPNAELGHLEIRGKDAERRASDRVRVAKKMSWQRYAKHLQEYLSRLEFLFSPDMFIIGGGVSKESDNFLPLLHLRSPVVSAELLNEAGIVGAALAAERASEGKTSLE